MAAVTNCTVCESQSIVKTAVKWCFECDEAFCHDCLKYHSNAKSTKSHDIKDVSDLKELPEFVLKIKQHCEDHGAPFQNYCLSHERPCCNKCINTTHKNCTDLPPLDDVTKDARTSTAVVDIQKRLQVLKEYYERLCQEKESNAKEIKVQSKTIIEHVLSTRLKLNQLLDRLEREIRRKVSELENSTLQSIEKITNNLKHKENRVSELYNGITKMRNHSSDLQIFIGTKEFEIEIRTHEKEVEEFNRDHQLNKRSIVFQENTKLSVFYSELASLGDVAIETQPSTISYTQSREKQAQSTVNRRHIDDINLKVEKQFNFQGTYVFGSTILENDTVCFADFAKHSLFIKYANESQFHSIDLNTKPYDLSKVDSQTLAVTTGCYGSKILIVNLKEKSVEKTINTAYYCCGVSFFDGNLFYSSQSRGLLSQNLQNGIMKDLDIGSKAADGYVAVHDGKIYCTENTPPLIQCYNADNTLAWEFKDKSLREPRGIAVDNSGIVYVGNQDAGTVVMISQDGSKHKAINIEGITKPRTLSFNEARTRLLICGLEGSAGIFDVT